MSSLLEQAEEAVVAVVQLMEVQAEAEVQVEAVLIMKLLILPQI
jgi:hypothetical protein